MRPKEMLRILKLGGKHLKTLSFNEVVIDRDDDEKAENVEDEMEAEESGLMRLEVTTCDEGETFPWTQVFKMTRKLQVSKRFLNY